jgi:hypothetical protein
VVSRPAATPSLHHSNTPSSSIHSPAPSPSIHESTNPIIQSAAPLLDALAQLLSRFIILPKWGAETLALWILHTYAFHLRAVSTYIGIESPEKRCGKTTLLSVLSKLVNRPIAAANISPPAFFRVIQDTQPTLLIDEADTFLQGNDELRGILNAGYTPDTAIVWRIANSQCSASASASSSSSSSEPKIQNFSASPQHSTTPSPFIHQSNNPPIQSASPSPSLHHSTTPSDTRPTLHTPRSTRPTPRPFSCWCPKIIASIGRLPDTLADRCIVIRMHRKTQFEQCDRLRNLDAADLKQDCVRFVAENSERIASAQPKIPDSLNDRAADIWEPLLALADLAGSDWPERARQAAVALSASSQENNPIGALLLDIFIAFQIHETDRLFTRTLLETLSVRPNRPWAEMRNGKPITDMWLAQQLRPYGIRPKTVWIDENHAKGYFQEDFADIFRRYIPHSEVESLRADWAPKTTNGS